MHKDAVATVFQVHLICTKTISVMIFPRFLSQVNYFPNRLPISEVNSEMLDLLREADSARTNGGVDGAGGGPPIPGWILEAVEMLEAVR